MISVKHISTAAKRLGFWPVIRTLGKEFFFGLRSRVFRKRESQQVYRLPASNQRVPMFCRPFSSDLYAYYQIFIETEYDCTDVIERPKLIVDCGANVGYTCIFLLNKYPGAKVIALEPDPDNFEILKRNVQPYGKQVISLNAAIWSASAKLCLKRDVSGFRGEWSTRVAICDETTETDVGVDAIDIGQVLEASGYERIDILKIDIEGAESEIFSKNYSVWIDKVDCFIIELHSDKDSKCFFEALSLSNTSYRYSQSGELTVAVREAASM